MTDRVESNQHPSSASSEITPETAKRVCKHMNEDHALSIYAMAKRKVSSWPKDGGTWKISDATLQSVSMEGCVLQVVFCRNDLCQVQKVTYPFEPRLKHASELRPRLVAIHQEVCKPSFTSIWLSSPLAIIIALGFAGSAYCALVLGLDQLTVNIENSTRFHSLISTCFGSATNFAYVVGFVFFFTISAHTLEALSVVMKSRVLKFSTTTTAAWVLQVFVAGFPVFQQFRDLFDMHTKIKAAGKEK